MTKSLVLDMIFKVENNAKPSIQKKRKRKIEDIEPPLSSLGYFDMVAYEKFHEGKMSDYIPTDEELTSYREKLPKVD